jgi:hypothetical protein
MSDLAISVTPDPDRVLAFDVAIRDARSESRHRVTISAEDAARLAKFGTDPAGCVEAAMRFLTDREPKEAILSAFDIAVIRHYFPEFDDALPGYLSSLGGNPAKGPKR